MANGQATRISGCNGMEEAIVKVLKDNPDAEDPFFILDTGKIIQVLDVWRKSLPRVKPFYAVKCNPNPFLLKTLAALGTGFDCASKNEIDQILKLGVSPGHILFANTVKFPSHIKFAKEVGVEILTFDSIEELNKISNLYSKSKLVLRIKSPDYGSKRGLSNKFGATMTGVPALLAEVKRLGLNLIGVSFHVGNDALSGNPYVTSIRNARNVFDLACEQGFQLKLLDIGGGFSIVTDNGELFASITADINTAFDQYFPQGTNVEIVAEPGTFFAEAPFTLVANVILRTVVGNISNVYLSDGIYGSLRDTTDNVYKDLFKPYLLRNAKNEKEGSLMKTRFWGPTCDSGDAIGDEIPFPEANTGDWVCVPNWGAYTLAQNSIGFNGMPVPEVKGYCLSDEALAVLKGLTVKRAGQTFTPGHPEIPAEYEKLSENLLCCKV